MANLRTWATFTLGQPRRGGHDSRYPAQTPKMLGEVRVWRARPALRAPLRVFLEILRLSWPLRGSPQTWILLKCVLSSKSRLILGPARGCCLAIARVSARWCFLLCFTWARRLAPRATGARAPLLQCPLGLRICGAARRPLQGALQPVQGAEQELRSCGEATVPIRADEAVGWWWHSLALCSFS